MSQKWIHGLKPPPSLAELTPDDCEMIDGELRPKVASPKWKDGVSFIVNGGTSKLDDATVPIEWRFTDEFKLERPQYIVICDHEMPLSRLEEERYHNYGRRYLVKVTKFAKYLQLFRAGTHHLVFMVFCGDEDQALHQARRYESNHGDRCYDNGVYFKDVENGWSGDSRVFYLAHVEFEVPKKAFAEEYESGFWKHLRFFANLWFRNEPDDLCYQRRRYPLVLITPPLFFLWRLLTGVFGTLYTIVVWSLALFFGWMPRSMLGNLKNSWTCPGEVDVEPSEFPWGVLRYGGEHNGEWRDELKAPFWCMPWFVCSVIGLPWAIYRAYKHDPFVVQIGAAIVAFSILVVFIFWLADALIKRAHDRRDYPSSTIAGKRALKKKELRRRAKEEREMQEYLAQLDTMSIGAVPVPKTVDVNAVIKKAKPRIKLELSYWALKSKVCKPFER